MTRLLRAPWLAALLLVLSPGAAGVLLPVLHPCQAQQEAGHHGVHAGEHAPGSHETGSGDGCTCVGSCHVPALLAPSGATVRELPLLMRVDGRAPRRPGAVSEVSMRPADRLPPPTAPPLT